MSHTVSWRQRGQCWLRIAATGGRAYLADNPPGVTAVTLLPRAVLQTVFIVLLADLAGGPRLRASAFAGAVALTTTLSTTVGIADVPSSDKWSGTFWRIRTGTLSPFTVLALRSWPYPVVGFCTSVVTLFAVAPLSGSGSNLPRLLLLLPVLVLLALTTAAAGLAGAAFAVGRRADVLVGNLLTYAMLLGSGGVLRAGRIRWVDLLGDVLPLRHGLAAAQALQDGRAFGGQLAAEAVVGTAWLATAWILIAVQVRRARAAGHDDFA